MVMNWIIIISTNRDSSNDVLDISTDDSFCKSFTKSPIVLLVNNKPVLNDLFLLQRKVIAHQQLIPEVWSVLCLFMSFALDFSTVLEFPHELVPKLG